MAKLETLTRNIFNNSSRGRMNSSMEAQKVNRPIAQLCITAENPFNTASVRQRLVPIYIGKGSLSDSYGPTDRLVDLHRDEGLQARFTSHVLSFIRYAALENYGGWAHYISELHEIERKLRATASQMLIDRGASASNIDRVSSLVADMALTFDLLARMAVELKMDAEFLARFSMSQGMGGWLVEHMEGAYQENRATTPGVSLLNALRALLTSQQAHIGSAEDPFRPPMLAADSKEPAAGVNADLGWKPKDKGEMVGAGRRIGLLKQEGDDALIIFYPDTAFNEAARAYPQMIPPGQSGRSSWGAMWDEDLTAPGKTRRKRGSNLTVNSRIRIGEGRQIDGIPVMLSTLLGTGTDED